MVGASEVVTSVVVVDSAMQSRLEVGGEMNDLLMRSSAVVSDGLNKLKKEDLQNETNLYTIL